MTVQVRRGDPGQPAESPVRQGSLRLHNLALTFRQIVAAAGVPVSRIELSTSTGLTRPTISRIVEELLAGGLIVEAGPAHSGGSGRPRVGLVLSRRGPAGLGLDVRGGSLAACVVDLTGAVRQLCFTDTVRPDADPTEVLAGLAEMAGTAIRAAAAEDLTVVGATVAVPGPVQQHSLVRFAPALGWRDVDAGALLRAAIGVPDLPVVVDNEAMLAALGELYASHEDLRDFICVAGELGLGAGIVLGGRLLRGARGWSGELGHVTVAADGPPCRCGANGCLQGYASIEAILAAAGQPPAQGTPVAGIVALADAGSPAVLAALDRAGTALGTALASTINVLDVGVVLLGGSYSLLASWLSSNIVAQLHRRVLSAAWAPVEVRPAQLGPDAAVIGAALTAIDEVRHNPGTWLGRTRR